MSLISAVLRSHIFLDHLYPLPYSADIKNICLIDSKINKRPFHKFVKRILLLITTIFLIPVVLWRLYWLVCHWKSYTKYNIQEGMFYFMTLNILMFGISSSLTVVLKGSLMQYIINQRYIILSKSQNPSKTLSNNLIPKLFVYGGLVFGLVLPAAVPTLTIRRTYDPFQLIIGSSYFVKAIGGIYYGLAATHVIVFMFSLITLTFCFLEGVHNYSSEFTCFKPDFPNVSSVRFRRSYNRFRVCQILLIMAIQVWEMFLAAGIFTGILIASIALFGTVTMFGKLPLAIYVAAISLVVICFVNAILLPYMSYLTYKNGANFARYWKGLLRNSRDKRSLKACPPIGIKIGPYGLATAKLGICICEDIINNTLDLLLLGLL